MTDTPHLHERLRFKALHEEKTELRRRQEEAEAAPKAAYDEKNRGAGRLSMAASGAVLSPARVP